MGDDRTPSQWIPSGAPQYGRVCAAAHLTPLKGTRRQLSECPQVVGSPGAEASSDVPGPRRPREPVTKKAYGICCRDAHQIEAITFCLVLNDLQRNEVEVAGGVDMMPPRPADTKGQRDRVRGRDDEHSATSHPSGGGVEQSHRVRNVLEDMKHRHGLSRGQALQPGDGIIGLDDLDTVGTKGLAAGMVPLDRAPICEAVPRRVLQERASCGADINESAAGHKSGKDLELSTCQLGVQSSRTQVDLVVVFGRIVAAQVLRYICQLKRVAARTALIEEGLIRDVPVNILRRECGGGRRITTIADQT
jgi:hypothetical protein